eukprot:superscaffoldBa00002212_g13559
MLIFDGHASHISLSLALKAKQNNVVLLRLPSCLTQILQPLDRAVFREVKRRWRTKLWWHSCVTRDKIRKENFPSKLKAVLEIGLKGENLKSGFKSTGIYPYCPDRVITEDYIPFTMEDGQAQPQPLAEAMTSNDTPLGPHVVTLSPLAQPRPARKTPLNFPVGPCATAVSLTAQLHPCSTSVGEESMSQIILSVETIAGSNILNISNIEVAMPANHEMSQPQPTTSAYSATSSPSPSSGIGIKDFFLLRIMLTKKSKPAKRHRIHTLKYGDSLTSEQALLQLEESEKKKAAKKKQPKDGKTKSKKAPLENQMHRRQWAMRQREENEKEGRRQMRIQKPTPQPSQWGETCTMLSVFMKPAAYHIARSHTESTPPEGERYVMKFLDRRPNNTFLLPSRDKIEDVEHKFILCKAGLEGPGPFYLCNH